MASFTQNLTNFVTRQVGAVREVMTPVLRESKFDEKGVMTPEEFVIAGDLLVYKCRTWEWAAGDPALRKSYLPPDKQYLVTKNIPCLTRVNTLLAQTVNEEVVDTGNCEEDEDRGWLATHVDSEEGLAGKAEVAHADREEGVAPLTSATKNLVVTGEDTGDSKMPAPALTEKVQGNSDGGNDDDGDYADMEDFEDENLLVEDDANALDGEDGYDFADDMNNIQLTRRYDIFLTYDKYYQTPRVFLSGSDEMGQPMRPEQILEDIMQDYANKTVTIEAFPHLAHGIYASIHPCKHSAVMKKIVDHLKDSGRTARVDQYIFIFLKFIQSVIPTMNYDHTMAMEVST